MQSVKLAAILPSGDAAATKAQGTRQQDKRFPATGQQTGD